MANFSTAFGYKTYIMPLASTAVDTTFAGITGGAKGIGSTFFLQDVAAEDDNLAASDATVAFTSPAFTIGGNVQSMDGLGDSLNSDNYVSLVGLTNAALETDTDSEEVITYDDTSLGFSQTIATGKSWSVSLAGVADFADAGYQVLRLAEQNTVADSLRVKFVRIGPTGTDEAIYGYGTLTGYTESIEAGSIVSWEATVEGYGPYRLVVNTL
jgi:predicted secreted protein